MAYMDAQAVLDLCCPHSLERLVYFQAPLPCLAKHFIIFLAPDIDF